MNTIVWQKSFIYKYLSKESTLNLICIQRVDRVYYLYLFFSKSELVLSIYFKIVFHFHLFELYCLEAVRVFKTQKLSMILNYAFYCFC